MKIVLHKSRSAFSLIELMVVLGVVGLLMAFAAPNLFSLISSSTLTGEGQVLRNQLTFAQQTAISKSADVEVRFFLMADPSSARPDESFRAFQLFQYNVEGELAPVSQYFRIRAPVAIHRDLSTLLDPGANSAGGNDAEYGYLAPTTGSAEAPSGDGGRLRATRYVAFRFRPDGSTDLPHRTRSQDTWYITLVQGEGALQSSNPDNFLCLQINPYNGQISEFRP